MKQYSHAWLAFKAIERLEKAPLPKHKKEADELVRWLRDHRDGLIKGAWYPDKVFKDMGNSHVLKFKPDAAGKTKFLSLPPRSQFYKKGVESPLYGRPYSVEKADNLHMRCEALAHSIIDNLKMQETEEKGSPIAPSDNHIAARLFILSHYIADAHMPLHCDSRPFSSGKHLHDKIEDAWEREVEEHFEVDRENEQFLYNRNGYPLRRETDYSQSFLKQVDDGLSGALSTGFGKDEEEKKDFCSVGDYMWAVCQYSYLIAYRFIPPEYQDDKDIDMKQWRSLPNSTLTFDQFSAIAFSDAVDAIARIWLRVWLKFTEWKKT